MSLPRCFVFKNLIKALYISLLCGFCISFASAKNQQARSWVLVDFDRDHSCLLHVLIADSPNEHEQGVMFMSEGEIGDGMLFVFEPPRPMNFWMKNTLVSLDVYFFDENGLLLDAFKKRKPLSLDMFGSHGNVKYVIETITGRLNESPVQMTKPTDKHYAKCF